VVGPKFLHDFRVLVGNSGVLSESSVWLKTKRSEDAPAGSSTWYGRLPVLPCPDLGFSDLAHPSISTRYARRLPALRFSESIETLPSREQLLHEIVLGLPYSLSVDTAPDASKELFALCVKRRN
jgi:hypothetical protein